MPLRKKNKSYDDSNMLNAIAEIRNKILTVISKA